MDATCSLDCNPARIIALRSAGSRASMALATPRKRAIVNTATPCSLHSGACTLALGLACMHALTVPLRAKMMSATITPKIYYDRDKR